MFCLDRFDAQLAQALGESVFEKGLRERLAQENTSVRCELGSLQQHLKVRAGGAAPPWLLLLGLGEPRPPAARLEERELHVGALVCQPAGVMEPSTFINKLWMDNQPSLAPGPAWVPKCHLVGGEWGW